ncbi:MULTISPECIES: 3-dehydroquinate synthase [unclassified Clostridioides]|uniref:3-dehydroquinate synthase n=1 Tax=unclassified Clostridioides TaxID=2635829 RepID=UPI001D12C411|nr:3-dehydroquinate synthase [Clostridioides sp. ZZV14-6150]MCC0723656.1 3-dehydroquinate synthase [Clostridioides sp. ZZV14-6104]MCC0741523.1 3-dehydroquinate synthase [Clostridioides sp. ZZV14-6044]MCC0751909.1 3-dehydroquinate synthase [Clostridioides sp. ZZV13-5731]
MEEKLLVNLKENSYNIFIKKSILKNIGKEIKKIYSGNKIFIVTDENIAKLYLDEVKNNLIESGFETRVIILEAGEETKSFNTLPKIYDSLLDFKLTRKDLIITLGGGVIGDLGGFTAATFLRGVNFIQIPTSLLAQVDSSVGGKVGVDLERGKNLVGSFYQPKAVFIDPDVLSSLPEKFYRDGMAEVIKYGCIKDKTFFNKLVNLKNREEVMQHIEYIIHKCCLIKKTVVEADEKDLGDRMLLNFGHTLGHAIEKHYNFTGYTHGEAVGVGMYKITLESEKRGITKQGTSELIKSILINYDLPYEVELGDNKSIIDTISLDKKNLGDTLKIILLKDIGESIIYDTTSKFFQEVK